METLQDVLKRMLQQYLDRKASRSPGEPAAKTGTEAGRTEHRSLNIAQQPSATVLETI